MKNQWVAYGAGSVLIFGACLLASVLPISYVAVILMMGVPSLLAGHVFAEVIMPYIWGMLLGLALYMGAEYLLYGPIFKATGPIYGAGFVLAVACGLSGTWWYNWNKAKSL